MIEYECCSGFGESVFVDWGRRSLSSGFLKSFFVRSFEFEVEVGFVCTIERQEAKRGDEGVVYERVKE